MLLVLLAAAPLGCCVGDDAYLTFGIGSRGGSTTPRWGEAMEWFEPHLTVSFPAGRTPGGEPLEVYLGDVRVDVASSTTEVDNSAHNGCGVSTHVDYALESLPAGEYTLVHRRAHGTGDPINCLEECPWTTFAEETALVMTLVVLPAPEDAGSA